MSAPNKHTRTQSTSQGCCRSCYCWPLALWAVGERGLPPRAQGVALFHYPLQDLQDLHMTCRTCRLQSAVEGTPTRRSRGQTQAARGVNDQRPTTAKGNWRVPCSCLCLCVKTPAVAHGCYALPRPSTLCGCINMSLAVTAGRQAINAGYGVNALPHVRCV
jgi:hypothetical protein